MLDTCAVDQSEEPEATRPYLRAIGSGPGIDLDAASRAVADLLIALGQDPSSEHLADTPRRVAVAYAELLTPTPFNLPPSPTARATTNSSWPEPSPSSPCASTTCCPSTASPTSATCPPT